MAPSDEGAAEVAALRKRIEHGLMLLRKEANVSTKERMKAASVTLPPYRNKRT